MYEEGLMLLKLNFPTKHRHIMGIDVVHIDKERGAVFFLLELASGGDLEQWIASQRLYRGTEEQAQDRIGEVFCQMASALAFCHAQHILHGDIKPANIMMTEGNHDECSEFV